MYKTGIKLLYVAAAVTLMSSCNWFGGSTGETETSEYSEFVSLSFAANDTFPGLAAAKFEVVYNDTVMINGEIKFDSMIVTTDSLRYQTDIRRVIPAFAFKSSSQAYILSLDSLGILRDTIHLTGKDTVDFTRAKKIVNIASDGKSEHKSEYWLKVNVHQVNPELYVWRKINRQIETSEISNVQAYYFQNTMFCLVNYNSPVDANFVHLYTSVNGIDWQQTSPVWASGMTNFGALHIFGKITEHNNKLYVIGGNHDNIYSSDDGYNWTNFTNNAYIDSYQPHYNSLFSFKNKLWAVVKLGTANYAFASSENGERFVTESAIPDNFPVSDFATLTFTSAVNQPKLLVVGGISKYGDTLKTVWSTENGSYWVDFSKSNSNLKSNANAALVKYNDRIFLFGAKYYVDSVTNQPILESFNDGLSWSIPDTTYNFLKQTVINEKDTVMEGKHTVIKDTVITKYEYRSSPSALYVKKPTGSSSDNHFIYLIGGRKNNVEVLSDVWCGQLNKMAFKK